MHVSEELSLNAAFGGPGAALQLAGCQIPNLLAGCPVSHVAAGNLKEDRASSEEEFGTDAASVCSTMDLEMIKPIPIPVFFVVSICGTELLPPLRCVQHDIFLVEE